MRPRRRPHRECARTDKPPDDRMTRALRAQLSAACPPAHSHSSHYPMLGIRREWTNLHSPGRSRRAARRPLECHVKRGEFQDCEPSQLLFGIRIGTVLYVPLSIFNSYGSPSLRHLQRIPANEDTCLYQSLVVGPPGAGVGIGSVVAPYLKSFR